MKAVAKSLVQSAGAVLSGMGPSVGLLGNDTAVRDVHAQYAPSDDKAATFFGYFDRSIQSNGRVAYHRIAKESDELVDIVVNGAVVARSSAWNLQQGAQLHWLDGRHIVYNTLDTRLHSIIRNVDNGAVQEMPVPIAAVSPDGLAAIGVDFGRIGRLRPDYGYRGVDEPRDAGEALSGVFRLLFTDGSVHDLFRLADLCAQLGIPRDQGHELNHPVVSPSGNQYVVLLRSYQDNRVQTCRLVLGDMEGHARELVSAPVVSHYAWLDNESLMVWMEHAGRSGYWSVSVQDSAVQPFFQQMEQPDGHPSFCAKNRRVVFDEYPGVTRLARLKLASVDDKEVLAVGQFRQPLRYTGAQRCDLHPRWNESCGGVFVDSAHTGTRRLYEIVFGTAADAL